MREGVGSVRLGASSVQAGVDLAQWGPPKAFARAATGARDESDWTVARSAMAIFVYCDESGHVEAIELSSPGYGVVDGDVVVFDEVDLFGAPADAVIELLRRKGYRVVEREQGRSIDLPEVMLALWRDGGPADDLTGMPVYFESVLLARPGYGE
jgi:hypothetical protein